MEMGKEEVYVYWLGNVKGIGTVRKRKLAEAYPASQIYKWKARERVKYGGIIEKEAEALEESKKNWDLEGEFKKLHEKGITYISWFHKEYPQKLKEITYPPFGIYVKGKLPDPDIPAIAVVGARRCSYYGKMTAYEFGGKFAEMGVQVVSGLARGIDGFAQKGTADSGGSTFGIMGCGVDVCYPKEHRNLYEEIQKAGGILSEYAPGTEPRPAHFPARNRLISAFSDAVLVVEAREKSGSLITADMALEQGKDVYAIPGRIKDALSTGCNKLIRQGAGLVILPEDITDEFSNFVLRNNIKFKNSAKILETNENMVYSCLDLQPKNINHLFQELPYSITELSGILLTLEIKGFVTEISKNCYVKTREIPG